MTVRPILSVDWRVCFTEQIGLISGWSWSGSMWNKVGNSNKCSIYARILMSLLSPKWNGFYLFIYLCSHSFCSSSGVLHRPCESLRTKKLTSFSLSPFLDLRYFLYYLLRLMRQQTLNVWYKATYRTINRIHNTPVHLRRAAFSYDDLDIPSVTIIYNR